MLVADAGAARRGQRVPRDLPRPLRLIDVHDHELLALSANPHPLADQLVRDRVDRITQAHRCLAVDLA